MHTQAQSHTLIRRPEVERRTGLKRSHIYAMMKAGAFPQAVPLGARAVAWVDEEISAWIAGRIKAARKEASHNVAAVAA